jgi:type II secretory pathway pseudopilin PulG
MKQKGAMFGLDARIALAIFGALSVISGAALYSAIQDSKATAILSDMQEIGKAWEQYYLDTGTTLSRVTTGSGSDNYKYIVRDLVEDPGVKGWKGPYLSNEAKTDNTLKFKDYFGYQMIFARPDVSWGGFWSTDGECIAGTKCASWVYLVGVQGVELANKIDEKVDGSVDLENGNFRAFNGGSPYYARYILKLAPVKNPND